jgi:PAS domain-containing protein
MNQGFQESHGNSGKGPLADTTPELARSQAELKAIYDASPVMMCVVDKNRRVLFANPAFTALIDSPDEPRMLLCLNDVTDHKKA